MDRPSSPLASRTAAPAAISPSPQDAYPPAQVALLVEQVGVKKATLPAVPTLALGVLAGAFIAFGAMFSTLALPTILWASARADCSLGWRSRSG